MDSVTASSTSVSTRRKSDGSSGDQPHDSVNSTHALKRALALIGAVALIAATALLPQPAGLDRQGMMALGILLAAVVMWFTSVMPQGVTGLLAVAALIVLGVVPDFTEALSGFTSPTTWFILCVFCMTAVMTKTTLGVRLTHGLATWAGSDANKLVLALMVGTALASFFMTDTGAVVLGMSMALPILKTIHARPGSSNLGKCLMLGIAFSGVLGGFAMPCGHSLNILGIGVMEQTVHETVSFLGWMSVGIPVLIVMLPLTWFILIKTFPPESLADFSEVTRKERELLGPMSLRDRKALGIVMLLPILWIASNWIPQINTTIVAMIGLFLLFLPGMDIMSWRDFQDVAGWNVFLFFGSVVCLGNAVSATGGTDFIATTFMDSGVLGIHPLFVLMLVAFALYIIHTFCPVAPALCLLFLPPLLLWAQAVGISTAAPVLIVASITAGSFLVPLNPTIAVTYEQGFYRFGEVAKGGWISAIAFVVITVLWTYFMCEVVGFVQAIPV